MSLMINLHKSPAKDLPARITSKGSSSSASSFQLLVAQMGNYVQENMQLLRLDWSIKRLTL